MIRKDKGPAPCCAAWYASLAAVAGATIKLAVEMMPSLARAQLPSTTRCARQDGSQGVQTKTTHECVVLITLSSIQEMIGLTIPKRALEL